MILYFNPDKVPRTTTRQQWREMHRWLRQTERTLKDDHDKRMDNLILFGTTHPELASRWADEMINPPLLLGPHT